MNTIFRSLITLVLIVAAMQLSSQHAMAQFGGSRIDRPLDRPTVSPYLNMFRRGSGNNPILNYYGAVRPQKEFYEQDQKFEKGLQDLEERGYSQRNLKQQDSNRSFRRYRMGITGHQTGFMTIGRGGAGGGGDEGGGGGRGSFGNDDDQSPTGRSGHAASFGSGNSGSRF